MSEFSTSGEENKVQNADRRKFLKRGITGTIAALAAGTFLEKEHSKFEEGIITSVGTFIPLYERHDLGIKESEIASDLNGFFREVVDPNLMKSPPQDILEMVGTGYDNPERKQVIFFPDQILQKLKLQGTEIIVGDILPGEEAISSAILATFIESTISLGFLGIIIANKLENKLTHFNELEHKKDTRRGILKKALVGFSIWGLAPTVTTAINIVGGAQEGAIKRIAARLSGISSDFHPEILLVFLRNAMMADKLLTVAEQMKSQTGKNPKIAFQVHGGHSGIEDFLVAGSDVCRFLVLSYPDSVLKPIVEYNNGIKDFCSARLFKFSKDTSPNTSGSPDLENISERRIIDTNLQLSLEKKFQA